MAASDAGGPATPPAGRVARVRMVEGGPVLVEGPVEVELPNGTRMRSGRPVVALCACRRSKRYPFCDTSHRRRVKPAATPTGSDRSDDVPADQARES